MIFGGGAAWKASQFCTLHRKDIVVVTRWLTLCGYVIIRCYRQLVFFSPVFLICNFVCMDVSLQMFFCRSVRGSRSFFTGRATELCVFQVLASLFHTAFKSAKCIRHSHPAVTLIISAITTIIATVTSVTISPGTGSFLLLCSVPQAHSLKVLPLCQGTD